MLKKIGNAFSAFRIYFVLMYYICRHHYRLMRNYRWTIFDRKESAFSSHCVLKLNVCKLSRFYFKTKSELFCKNMIKERNRYSMSVRNRLTLLSAQHTSNQLFMLTKFNILIVKGMRQMVACITAQFSFQKMQISIFCAYMVHFMLPFYLQ